MGLSTVSDWPHKTALLHMLSILTWEKNASEKSSKATWAVGEGLLLRTLGSGMVLSTYCGPYRSCGYWRWWLEEGTHSLHEGSGRATPTTERIEEMFNTAEWPNRHSWAAMPSMSHPASAFGRRVQETWTIPMSHNVQSTPHFCWLSPSGFNCICNYSFDDECDKHTLLQRVLKCWL